MKSKILLTSIVAIGFAAPAFAEVVNNPFPSDGYMQESQTYTNAATYDNMGVYEGTVTASAEYTDDKYNIPAGSYLLAGAEGTATQCPVGSYCTGLTDVTYNADAAQGIESCPAGYPNSAAGASASTQCYTACTVANANIAHATAVSGNDYNGGNDTCAATDCDPGYHVLSRIGIEERTPLIPVDYHESGDDYAYISADGGNTRQGSFGAGLTANNTWASHFEYGTVYGQASCQSTGDAGYLYMASTFESVLDGSLSVEEFETELAKLSGEAKAAYMADLVTGMRDGSKTEEDFLKGVFIIFGQDYNANYSTDSTGQYCYCQMTGYTPVDGEKQSVVSAPWVFNYDVGSADACASHCAYYCASPLLYDGADYDVFRAAVFGSLGALVAGTCEANEISITWTDAANPDEQTGMCTYDGDITTPTKANEKPGKTFKGWKFVKTNSPS
ncbi:MAG: hypothetical protein IKA73_01920 [Alphaproteobacteria bacterium]|nr:hypothetical protein [Alphaproteobacteria bacterium]